MSLTRKMLKEMGIQDANIEKIIAAHAETVGALKKAPAVPEVDWKSKYEELYSDYEGYKQSVEQERLRLKKEGILRELLKECGVVSECIEPIVRVSCPETIDLGEDGSPVDIDGLKLEISEHWKAFIPKTATVGAKVAAPPKGTGVKTYTREDIRRMSSEEINRNYTKIMGDLRNSN